MYIEIFIILILLEKELTLLKYFENGRAKEIEYYYRRDQKEVEKDHTLIIPEL